MIKLSVSETKWSSLLARNPRSYSLYFGLNIWFRARKVTRTFEKRASGCKRAQRLYGVWFWLFKKWTTLSTRKNLCPLDSATGLSNTYPLDGDLSRRMAVDTAIHLLNKLSLELSKLGSGNVWLQAWPFLKQKHLSPIRKLNPAILRCSKIRSRGSSNTPRSLKL